jgi:hypothetical protein
MPTLSLYAYEIDCDGRGYNVFEVYDVDHGYLTTVPNEDMGDWLAESVSMGYDVQMNTVESWEARVNG